MLYLMARCPMHGCKHSTPVCTICGDALPEFDRSVHVFVRCSNCGEVFRELASHLEPAHTVAEPQVDPLLIRTHYGQWNA